MDASSKQSRDELAQRNVQNAVTSLEAKQAQAKSTFNPQMTETA